MKKVGVILAGCGHMDGAEVRESVLTLLYLDKLASKNPFEIVMMAPNRNQHHVMDHFNKEEIRETRNILVESARIARGNIHDIASIDPNNLDALIMPGGFGAAKNLCDFAFKGSEGAVDDHVTRLLNHCHENKKPIGGICISPAIISLVLGSKGVTVTVGANNETINEVKATGANHQDCLVTEICFDEANRLVTTPAYMHGQAKTHEVAEGIEKCVEKVIALTFNH